MARSQFRHFLYLLPLVPLTSLSAALLLVLALLSSVMQNPDLNCDLNEDQEPKPEISEAKLRANRENALRSTEPVTRTGLEKSSKNGLKTGLSGATVLLPTEDLEE